MPLALGYCRVSSDEQATHGISIDAQRDILNGYAAMTQQPIRIFEDAGFSGKNMNRPALQQLLSSVKAGETSAVVVWKLDRLSRSLRDTLTIIEDILQPAGVALVSVTESIDTSSPSGRMMLNMLASFAQLEREQDSDRVVMAHKHLARDCKYLGGHVPLGYRVDDQKHYQLDPVTSPIARRVFDMYLSRSGYGDIMGYLNAPDVFPLTGKGTPFRKPDLNFMLKNEIYAGTYVRRMGTDPRHRISSPETIRIPGGVPALLSAEEWERACAIRETNRDGYRQSYQSKNVYPLSGKVYCSVCGQLMPLRHGGKERDGTQERYYACKSKCVPMARLEKVEAAVFTALEAMAADPDMIAQACAIANEFSDMREEDNRKDIAPQEARLQEISKQTSRILAFIKKHGENAPASMMQELIDLENESNGIKARLAVLSRPVTRYDTERTVNAFQRVTGIKNRPPEQQKELIQTVVHRVQVEQDSYRILLSCSAYGGDEPPRYAEQVIPRYVQ